MVFSAPFLTPVPLSHLLRCAARRCLLCGDQIIKDAKDGVKDSAQLVIVSYDLATRMVDKSLLWKGQVRNSILKHRLTTNPPPASA